MDENCEIMVKWPDGRTFSQDGYSEDSARATVAFLRECGAEDVKVTRVEQNN